MARVQEQRERRRGLASLLGRIFEPVVAVPMATGIIALALFVGSQRSELPEMVPVDVVDAGRIAPIPSEVPPVLVPEPARPGTIQLADLPDPSVVRMSSAEREAVLTEVQRRMIQTILARYPSSTEMAAVLRGAGHPHAASLASHFDDHGFADLQLVSAEAPRRR
jgi:hypothetical protein